MQFAFFSKSVSREKLILLEKVVNGYEIYLKEYVNGTEAFEGLKAYFEFYNHERPHQSLGYRTPKKVYEN